MILLQRRPDNIQRRNEERSRKLPLDEFLAPPKQFWYNAEAVLV
jgi:hypothetical protein